jgi:Carboxypeptidase regulatory-like domain/TonB-dependent Receptor Plug Domain
LARTPLRRHPCHDASLERPFFSNVTILSHFLLWSEHFFLAKNSFVSISSTRYMKQTLLYIILCCVALTTLALPQSSSADALVEEWGWFPTEPAWIAAESQGFVPIFEKKSLAEYAVISEPSLITASKNAPNPAAAPINPLTPTDLPPIEPTAPVPPGFFTLRGEVSEGLDPLPDAEVTVLGLKKTTKSAANGSFSIETLPTGNHSVEVTKLGYQSATQSFTALPGQAINLRFSLKKTSVDGESEATMMEEETVVGEFQENNAGDFNLSLNMETPKLTAVMGREEFTKNAVSDAGEAIAKVSGANIVDGKYAVVRGLADRYVTTTFNGAQIASADPSRKAVQLDMFPTSAIEAIKVDKTYTSNLSGDFGGGAIDIATRAMPSERILQVSSRITYNDSLKKKFYAHPNRDLGLLGDIGDDMPSVLETRNPDGSVRFLDTGNTPAPELTDKWKALHNSQSLRPKETDSQFGYSQSLTYGETFELENKMKLGLVTAFNRSTNDTFNTTPNTNQIRSFSRDEYSRSAEWAAYFSAALELNEYNTVQATYFKKHFAQDDVLHTYNIIDDTENLNYGIHLKNSNVNPGNTYGPDAIYYGAAWDIVPLERDLDIFQLKGSHSTGERAPRITWAHTNSAALENRPHSTHFEFGILDFTAKALEGVIANAQKQLDLRAKEFARDLMLPDAQSFNWQTIKQPMYDRGLDFIYDDFEAQTRVIVENDRGRIETSAHGANSGSVPGKQRITRRSEKSQEDATHSQAGVVLPYYFSDDEDYFFEFGFGASLLSKKRSTTARMYDLVLSLNSPTDPGFPPGSLDGPGGLGELIAANPNIVSDYFNGTVNSGPYYNNSLTLNGLENIRTRLDQFSYYYSGLLQMGKTFISGGLRFEEERYDIDIDGTPLAAFTDDQITGNGWERREKQNAVLPALTTGTSLFEDRLAFQFAWSKTIARPTFWEFIPSQTLDQGTGLGRRGNNLLSQTEIDNFDIAMTWAPSESTTIRASLFHKNLVRPMVSFLENGILLYADSNIDNATGITRDFQSSINGIELEAELDDLGPFSLKGNISYIDANLDYFYNVGGVSVPVVSKLPFQPTYLGNLNLGYEYEPWKLNTNFVYNYNGEYPVILKLRPDDQEVTRNAIHTFDLILSKLIETKHIDYTLRTGVRNIFSAADTYIFGNQVFDSEITGRSYWAEIQMSF